MSDPARFTDPRAADPLEGRDRDVRVEQLLLAGLDHYFASRYEQAVHVWTRVLFLDRGHARARAYIERARSAIAERQRQSEELLHRGTAAFECGETDAARSLLTAAVEQGAAPEVALGYLERLDRLDTLPSAAPPLPERRPAAEAAPAVPRRRRRALLWAAAAAALTLGLVSYVASITDPIDPSNARRPAPPAPVRAEALPVPRPSDLAMARARRLYATGHAADALRVLATIPRTDPHRPQADRLLTDIQRTLLAALGPHEPAQPEGAARR